MKVLLVNANRFQNPPVIPIGLEYIAASLQDEGYEVETLDLCFVENYKRHIDNALDGKTFDLVGVTFRNLDSAVFHTNRSYLKELKDIVSHLKSRSQKVVLGGTGFSIAPANILEYTGADIGVIGPGEKALVQLIEDIRTYEASYTFLNGADYNDIRYLVPYRGELFDYPRYIKQGGIIGFETQVGCREACPYCTEAGSSCVTRDVDCILEELRHLAKQKYYEYHLCDSEFNQDLKFSFLFAESLATSGLKIKWALYMKPKPHSPELFAALKASGAHLITLSVDSFGLENRYSYNDVESFLNLCRKNQIRVAIDLLIGLPYEAEDKSRRIVEFFKKVRPNTIGVNTYTRLYKFTTVTSQVKNDPELQKNLLGRTEDNADYLFPMFYNHIKDETLAQWIDNDPIFRIEGQEQSTNYQRIGK